MRFDLKALNEPIPCTLPSMQSLVQSLPDHNNRINSKREKIGRIVETGTQGTQGLVARSVKIV
jgi:hypothetical protein